MYKRWDSKRCRERTKQLMEEQLFCDLYTTLKGITEEYDEPSPAELWDEAASRCCALLASTHPQMATGMLRDELTEEYGERSAFLVLMVLMYMLVALFRPTKDSPYYPYCQSLAEVTKDHPLLQRLWEGVRNTEDEQEREGRKVGIVTSLLSEMSTPGQAIDFDTIEQRILQFPTFELQQKALVEADNLLRGTAWSKRSASVEKKMFAIVQEQREKQQETDIAVKKSLERPSIQNKFTIEKYVVKETNIENSYGPNIENNRGTLNLGDKSLEKLEE